MVRHHVEVFESASFDVAVARPDRASAASGTSRRCRPPGRRPALAKRATALAGRTYELSELLVDVLGVTDVGADYPHRVTYHPTCHSLRMLRVGDKPSGCCGRSRASTWSNCPAPRSAAASAARSP